MRQNTLASLRVRFALVILGLMVIVSETTNVASAQSTLQYRRNGGGGGPSSSPDEPTGPINTGTGGVAGIPAPGEGGITDQVDNETNQLQLIANLVAHEAEEQDGRVNTSTKSLLGPEPERGTRAEPLVIEVLPARDLFGLLAIGTFVAVLTAVLTKVWLCWILAHSREGWS